MITNATASKHCYGHRAGMDEYCSLSSAPPYQGISARTLGVIKVALTSGGCVHHGLRSCQQLKVGDRHSSHLDHLALERKHWILIAVVDFGHIGLLDSTKHEAGLTLATEVPDFQDAHTIFEGF